jgi:ABC-type transport system involved in Fe-S cluster assembly fused permease/ATPase subunit
MGMGHTLTIIVGMIVVMVVMTVVVGVFMVVIMIVGVIMVLYPGFTLTAAADCTHGGNPR